MATLSDIEFYATELKSVIDVMRENGITITLSGRMFSPSGLVNLSESINLSGTTDTGVYLSTTIHVKDRDGNPA